MIPPRRTGDLDLVEVLLGVEAVRIRTKGVVDALLAESEPTSEPCDGELVDCLLGLAALARAVEHPAPAAAAAMSEPVLPPARERLLR